jgi:hypothetical protein
MEKGRRAMNKAMSRTAAIKTATSRVSAVEHLGNKWVISGPTCMELSDSTTNYIGATWARRKWIAEIAVNLMGYETNSEMVQRNLNDLEYNPTFAVADIMDLIFIAKEVSL